MNIHFSCCCLDSRKRNAILCEQELTQKRETRGLCGGSAFYFPVALSWVSKQSKISPCSQLYINIYKYTHTHTCIFIPLQERSKTLLPDIFSALIRCFSPPFFMCFASPLRQRSDSAPWLCIFSDLMTILQQGKVARTVPVPCPVVCRKVAKLGHKSPTWAQF